MSKLTKKALDAKRETKRIEFKEQFAGSNRCWCELLKDIFALANSGGGVILLGVDNKGNPTGVDLGAVLNLDPADVTNKVYSYCGYNFSEFEISEAAKQGVKIACLIEANDSQRKESLLRRFRVHSSGGIRVVQTCNGSSR